MAALTSLWLKRDIHHRAGVDPVGQTTGQTGR